MILQEKQRGGVALLFFVSLSIFALTPGAAQVRNQKHVTAIQLGGAAEGSRVTVVSDLPLVDYEAFRRGDRFYVKIPLADFSSATPHFRADGFEDVQVQKVGDSLIVSFKLQAGATARVDQRGNRLDVIFSAANRSSSNKTTSTGTMTTQGPQTAVDRGRDAAGPMPSGSVAASRVRVVTDRAGSVNESRAPGDPRWQPRPNPDANRNSSKTGNDQLATGYVPVASPSPVSSPASILLPGNSAGYTPLTTNTPPPTSASSSPASGSSGSSDFLNWRNRSAAARQWMSTNRLATLLGALILLSLIVYLVTAIRRRKGTVAKTRRAKAPKVQPKYSPHDELSELPNRRATPRDKGAQPAANSQAIAAPDHDRPRILARPPIVSSSAGHEERSSGEEEREVFEL